jgi:hypothetical protein
MALGLTWYWMLRENGTDAARWLRFALDSPGAREQPSHPVAEALLMISELAMIGSGGPAVGHRDALVATAERLEPVLGLHPLVPLLQPLLYFFAEERGRALALTDRNLQTDDPWVRAASRTVRVAFRENDGDIEGMREDLEVGMAEWKRIGDHWGLAALYASRGQLRTMDGDAPGAAADLEAALGHMRLLGSTQEDLMVNMRLADLRLRAGDFDGARRFAEAMRGAMPADEKPGELGDGRRLLGDVMLGGIALELGDVPTVQECCRRVLAAVRGVESPSIYFSHLVSIGYAFLATVAAQDGRLTDAREFAGHSIVHGTRTADFPILAACGVSVATYSHVLGKDRDAAAILGAAARLRGADDPTQLMVSRLTTALRSALGDGFDVAYAEGKAMGRDEAIARLDPALLD